ncbi:hypothetical protein MA16_Dca026685 [Dendrobium catenatum]|uniref:Uncharacterized protein n=1 Tax=Dendrobium catenatum TaxID=906689 RepID=A0A2I0VJM6_9ASPA|nr:hypothetical protein MA16_Dca026685 [Dendrobium catenatum]
MLPSVINRGSRPHQQVKAHRISHTGKWKKSRFHCLLQILTSNQSHRYRKYDIVKLK